MHVQYDGGHLRPKSPIRAATGPETGAFHQTDDIICDTDVDE